MRCTHCGANIPDDQMICPVCGAEVQIVPDYNPLDDVLTREVRGSVEGATRQINTDDVRHRRTDRKVQNGNATRVLSQTELDRLREERRKNARRSGRSSSRQNTEEIRRQRQQKRLEAAKRKRRRLLTAMFAVIIIIAAIIYVAYQNSYSGMLKKGYHAIDSKNYTAAENYFNRAIVKDKSRPEAYTGYAQIYIDQDDLQSAEEVFLSAIETQPSNPELYQAVIAFYMDTNQKDKISNLLEDCEDQNVLDKVSDYISAAPEFSPEEGNYNEVQEITITSDTGGDIYYTEDGSEPTQSSTKYTEPILLDKEGEYEIRAIAVNSNGIPSVITSGKYTIEFPIADAPAVTPSTGQYTEPEQITITVPDGYTAYYTLDGSTPDPSSSSTIKYTGPVEMPENTQTIFNAILVNNNNGKATDVTTRNYITTQ